MGTIATAAKLLVGAILAAGTVACQVRFSTGARDGTTKVQDVDAGQLVAQEHLPQRDYENEKRLAEEERTAAATAASRAAFMKRHDEEARIQAEKMQAMRDRQDAERAESNRQACASYLAREQERRRLEPLALAACKAFDERGVIEHQEAVYADSEGYLRYVPARTERYVSTKWRCKPGTPIEVQSYAATELRDPARQEAPRRARLASTRFVADDSTCAAYADAGAP